jgi:hypothetical protein
MSEVVHILPGFNTAASRAMRPGDRTFVTTDYLSCGPLGPLKDVAEWRTGRLAFWRSISDLAPDEVLEDLLGDTAELLSARKVVIWLGTSLDNQLALAFLVALLRAIGAAPEQVDLIQFRANHRGIEILDLGMLDDENFAAHPPSATLSREDLAEVERSWSALTSSEPDALAEALASGYEPLPFFKRGLRALLLRYPEKLSGVNATELRILHWVRRDPPKAARIIGEVLGEIFAAARAGTGGLDLCGDVWLFQRILRLGDPSLREPAIEIQGSRTQYRNTSLRLTAFGERVLDGKANFVDVNGIDDWVAGVHLQSDAGRVWFHDEGKLVGR